MYLTVFSAEFVGSAAISVWSGEWDVLCAVAVFQPNLVFLKPRVGSVKQGRSYDNLDVGCLYDQKDEEVWSYLL